MYNQKNNSGKMFPQASRLPKKPVLAFEDNRSSAVGQRQVVQSINDGNGARHGKGCGCAGCMAQQVYQLQPRKVSLAGGTVQRVIWYNLKFYEAKDLRALLDVLGIKYLSVGTTQPNIIRDNRRGSETREVTEFTLEEMEKHRSKSRDNRIYIGLKNEGLSAEKEKSKHEQKKLSQKPIEEEKVSTKITPASKLEETLSKDLNISEAELVYIINTLLHSKSIYRLGQNFESATRILSDIVDHYNKGKFGLQIKKQDKKKLNKLFGIAQIYKKFMKGQENQVMKYGKTIIIAPNSFKYEHILKDNMCGKLNIESFFVVRDLISKIIGEIKKISAVSKIPECDLNKLEYQTELEKLLKQFNKVKIYPLFKCLIGLKNQEEEKEEIKENFYYHIIDPKNLSKHYHAEILLLAELINYVLINGFPKKREISIAGKFVPCVYCQKIINKFIILNKGKICLDYVKAQDANVLGRHVQQPLINDYDIPLELLKTKLVKTEINMKYEKKIKNALDEDNKKKLLQEKIWLIDMINLLDYDPRNK